MTEQNNEERKRDRRNTRIEQVKEKCRGTLKFSFVFAIAFHIAKIVIAAIYFKDCPVEPDIPKFLLVLGVLGFITKLVTVFKDFIIKYTKISPILSILLTADLAVFIVASYYIYREYKPNYNPLAKETYCNKTLYLFAFIYITVVYSIILLCVIGAGCFIIAIILLEKTDSEDIEENEKTTEVPLTTEAH